MQLMLDKRAGETGENGRSEGARGVANEGLPLAARFCLALASVWAAYFIMTDPWPATLIGSLFDTAPMGSLPPRMGTIIASLR